MGNRERHKSGKTAIALCKGFRHIYIDAPTLTRYRFCDCFNCAVPLAERESDWLFLGGWRRRLASVGEWIWSRNKVSRVVLQNALVSYYRYLLCGIEFRLNWLHALVELIDQSAAIVICSGMRRHTFLFAIDLLSTLIRLLSALNFFPSLRTWRLLLTTFPTLCKEANFFRGRLWQPRNIALE
jgi:hypothetical protein